MSNSTNSLDIRCCKSDAFMNALEDIMHFLENLIGGQLLSRSPKEGYIKASFQRQKLFLLQAIGFAKLPLDAVALDCTLEIAFGYRYHDAYFCLFAWHKDSTDRESRYRLMSANEQLLEYLATAKTLFFTEGVWDVIHLLCADGRLWQRKC